MNRDKKVSINGGIASNRTYRPIEPAGLEWHFLTGRLYAAGLLRSLATVLASDLRWLPEGAHSALRLAARASRPDPPSPPPPPPQSRSLADVAD